MNSANLSRSLGRSPLWVARMQKRFGLPPTADYPGYYAAFLGKVRDLLVLGVGEGRLTALWEMECRLVEILHLDQGEGEAALIASCATQADPDRRLLLSNIDLGAPLIARDLQAGLDFKGRPAELFDGAAMGEDALLIIGRYRDLLVEIRALAAAESRILKEAIRWQKTIA